MNTLSRRHTAYRQVLKTYRAIDPDSPSLTRFLIEKSIIFMVRLGARLRGWHFPDRATGGWWWTWRYRLEIIHAWYELESLAWCRRLLQPGMRALDIGAHIGYFSRPFSDWVGPQGEILAYEPCPENYPILQANLIAAPHSNVRAFNLAVSDQSGSATLFISPGHSNHSIKAGYTEAQGRVEVETIAIDRHLQRLNWDQVDFVKIDTEGAEMEVLEGMRKTIAHSPDLRMMVECNPRALRAGGSTPADLLALLHSFGFEARAIAEVGGLLAPDLEQAMKTSNWLCLRSEQWRQLQLEGVEGVPELS